MTFNFRKNVEHPIESPRPAARQLNEADKLKIKLAASIATMPVIARLNEADVERIRKAGPGPGMTLERTGQIKNVRDKNAKPVATFRSSWNKTYQDRALVRRLNAARGVGRPPHKLKG